MQADQLKQRIDRIEECVDDAERALQAGSAPQDLRQCVDQLHQQARQAQQQAGGQGQMGSEQQLRDQVMQMEQTGDRAMQACRQAGSQLDQQTQQAVQRAHDEISQLKKQIQMG